MTFSEFLNSDFSDSAAYSFSFYFYSLSYSLILVEVAKEATRLFNISLPAYGILGNKTIDEFPFSPILYNVS